MATTSDTALEAAFADVTLARGDSSLLILSMRTSDTPYANGGAAQCGTNHDAKKDIGRVALTSRTMAEPEPSLAIYLVPDSPDPTTGYANLRGTLRIKWGTTELTTPWRADQ